MIDFTQLWLRWQQVHSGRTVLLQNDYGSIQVLRQPESSRGASIRWSTFLLGSYACSQLAQAGPLACREAAATANLLADKLRQITFECQSVQVLMRQRQWWSFNG